ncbi:MULTISPECIES: GNAT family N-acetyltransferase [unclassified Oceanobacter]|uniref:GNAT family N-acetyltransferase n=1 Tax=unclassified Oceanobacter TaxID=2620260 RepID=UPI0026E18EBB|nr:MULTISPECIES: GNAT family protein [unclassified Oceanobacter]MDO6681291.1 GNAT family protein [Oceanobacter sp. 5_MG-2023]MDP2548569.1 GNAT family protein [Oceanobacter sp. 4_MG-2023]
MNWNLQAGPFVIRLPVIDQDGDALYGLLKDPDASAHIPKPPMYASVQSLDELRRASMKFKSREGACWLVECHSGDVDALAELLARVTLDSINWMLNSARLQWEVSPSVEADELETIIGAIEAFCFNELGLHRLEVALLPGSTRHEAFLDQLGYQYEGCLPAQLEFDEQWRDLNLYARLATDAMVEAPTPL